MGGWLKLSEINWLILVKTSNSTDSALKFLNRMVEIEENRNGSSWMLKNSSEIERMLRAIQVFRMPMEKVDVKFKLSQNQSELNVRGVTEGLEQHDREMQSELAKLMAEVRKNTN